MLSFLLIALWFIDAPDSVHAARFALLGGISLIVSHLSLTPQPPPIPRAKYIFQLLIWHPYVPALIAAIAALFAGYWWFRDAWSIEWTDTLSLLALGGSILVMALVAAIVESYLIGKEKAEAENLIDTISVRGNCDTEVAEQCVD